VTTVSATSTRHAIVATCLANAIEWYDFAVYGAMASILAVVLFPPGSGSTGLVAVFALFATSFLARPVGALLVGLRADRLGRRRALATMVLLMSGATAAIGLLPSWSAVGVAAPLGLLLLRLSQGFASGGEISTSIAFLVESAPPRRWGRCGGWHTATVALGIASGITVAGLVSAVLPVDDLETWGWRLPFLVALPLGMVGLYVRLRLDDPAGLPSPEARSTLTLRGVWRAHAQAVRTGFVLVAVLAATFNMWFVYLPSHLVTQHVQRLPVALGCAVGGLVAAAVTAPLLGSLSDRVGRRPVMFAGTSTLCVLVVPLYLLAVDGSWVMLLCSDLLVGAMLGAMVVSAHLAECFPATARATGIAMTFGLATATVGGTAPLVGSVLAAGGAPIAIPVCLAALGAAGAVASLRAPRAARPVSPALSSFVPMQRRGIPAEGDAHLPAVFHGGSHDRDGGDKTRSSQP
jgi:MHS family proline/betaine transporter-like MFS transporter